MSVDQKIKDFLLVFPYHTLHEEDRKKKHIEHFFVGIEKKDIKDAIVIKYLETHVKTFPLNNLSELSMEYINDNSDHYYILVDSLDKNDAFYKQKAKCVENNANNVLAMKWTGKPVDMSAHLVYNGEKYMEDFKDISGHLGLLAKEKIKENLMKGRDIFNDKKPLIEKKIKGFFKK